jgi:hypothetical protein
MEVIVLKLVLIIASVLILGGCTTYDSVRYERQGVGRTMVYEHTDEELIESDIVGKKCKLTLGEGTVIQGRINEVTDDAIYVEGSVDPIRKSEIIALELETESITGGAVGDTVLFGLGTVLFLMLVFNGWGAG